MNIFISILATIMILFEILFLLSFLLGGIVFKVYIVGESITVVKRFSLPNHGKRDLSKVAGMYPVPRVSSYLSSAEDADLDPSIAGEIVVLSFLFPKEIF